MKLLIRFTNMEYQFSITTITNHPTIQWLKPRVSKLSPEG